MLFVTEPKTAGDIRAFCARFDEGFRVEYKATFDDNVRRALPKVVSSFANSLGGVLVVGVRTAAGVPQPPIEGFEQPERQELPLTVQSICLQNLYPPIFPRCCVVESDVPGRVFLVIEVEESWEAPHAIENSKKAFVRTGDAANPYDLADVDLIIELIKRREEPLKLRENLLARARRHAQIPVPDATVFCQLTIGPPYPRRPVCSSQEAWQFLEQNLYRGGHFFPRETLRRITDGAAAFANHQYGEVNRFGIVIGRQRIETFVWRDQPVGPEFPCLAFRDPFQLFLKLLVCASRFYDHFQHGGNVSIEAVIQNTMSQRLPFIPTYAPVFRSPDDFLCFDDFVTAEQTVAAENLHMQREQILRDLFNQLCWSFWQADEAFPAETLHGYIRSIIEGMGGI